MDLTHDNIAGLETAGALAGLAGSTITSIRNNSKAKKALGISSAGDYLSLTSYQKSLIPVPQYVVDIAYQYSIPVNTLYHQSPAFIGAQLSAKGMSGLHVNSQQISPAVGVSVPKAGDASVSGEGVPSNPSLKSVDVPAAGGGVTTNTAGFKNYIPYIIGVVAVGLLLYFIIKRK
jgi:hypothetical protein